MVFFTELDPLGKKKTIIREQELSPFQSGQWPGLYRRANLMH